MNQESSSGIVLATTFCLGTSFLIIKGHYNKVLAAKAAAKPNDTKSLEAVAESERKAIATQVGLGTVSTLALGAISAMLIGKIEGEPLNLAAKWLVLPAATLLYGVMGVGSKRIPKSTTSREVIDGGKSATEL